MQPDIEIEIKQKIKKHPKTFFSYIIDLTKLSGPFCKNVTKYYFMMFSAL